MLNILGAAQNLVLLVLGLAAFACQVFAVVDASRHQPQAYDVAGKMTKQRWMLITGIGVAIGFLSLPLGFSPIGGPLNFLNLIAFVAAAVYLVDVRPALRSVRGRGSGTQSGPYGPW